MNATAPNPNNRLLTHCCKIGTRYQRYPSLPKGWDIEWLDTYGFENRGHTTTKGVIAFGYKTEDGAFHFVYLNDPSYTYEPDPRALGRRLDWHGALFLLARFLEGW